MEGEWQFQLPYTAERGEGAYLFIFYLFLGHVARNLGLSLPVTFHLARLLAAGLLLVSLFRFFEDLLGQSSKLAFLLAIFGSGLGWLATLFGLFTADFWVAEAYPFLSAYANPHFPLALALMLAALTRISNRERRSGWFQMALYAISGFILALILPFGIVLVVLLLLVLWIWRVADLIGQGERVSQIIFAPEAARRGLALAAGGAPVLLYYLWAVNSNPQLAAWNAQNLTPSPPWWDVLLAFSPALPVALLGAWWAWRAGDASLPRLTGLADPRPGHACLTDWATKAVHPGIFHPACRAGCLCGESNQILAAQPAEAVLSWLDPALDTDELGDFADSLVWDPNP